MKTITIRAPCLKTVTHAEQFLSVEFNGIIQAERGWNIPSALELGCEMCLLVDRDILLSRWDHCSVYINVFTNGTNTLCWFCSFWSTQDWKPPVDAGSLSHLDANCANTKYPRYTSMVLCRESERWATVQVNVHRQFCNSIFYTLQFPALGAVKTGKACVQAKYLWNNLHIIVPSTAPKQFTW